MLLKIQLHILKMSIRLVKWGPIRAILWLGPGWAYEESMLAIHTVVTVAV